MFHTNQHLIMKTVAVVVEDVHCWAFSRLIARLTGSSVDLQRVDGLAKLIDAVHAVHPDVLVCAPESDEKQFLQWIRKKEMYGAGVRFVVFGYRDFTHRQAALVLAALVDDGAEETTYAA